MPPGQPVHRCAGACDRLRPCKTADDGRWYCRDCHPGLSPSRADDDRHAASTAPRDVATDGGSNP